MGLNLGWSLLKPPPYFAVFKPHSVMFRGYSWLYLILQRAKGTIHVARDWTGVCCTQGKCLTSYTLECPPHSLFWSLNHMMDFLEDRTGGNSTCWAHALHPGGSGSIPAITWFPSAPPNQCDLRALSWEQPQATCPGRYVPHKHTQTKVLL